MTLAEALRAAALHVEQHKAALAWSGPEMPSEAERARAIAEASALRHELDSLAAASGTAQVYPREVEVVRRELQERGFYLPSEILQAIADAFLADAVARVSAPRFRVGRERGPQRRRLTPHPRAGDGGAVSRQWKGYWDRSEV